MFGTTLGNATEDEDTAVKGGLGEDKSESVVDASVVSAASVVN